MKFKDIFGIIGDMIGEVERVRFRTGESPNKPYGGNIADKPFPQTLHGLMVSGGYESQKSLSRASGISQKTISEWCRAESLPTQQLLDKVALVVAKVEKERKQLFKSYSEDFTNRKLARKDVDSSLEISRRMMRPSENPMGKWFEDLCEEIGITFKQGSERLESPGLLLRRRDFSLQDLDLIYKNAKDAFDLSEDKVVVLAKTIEKEKQYRIENGRRFQNGSNGPKVIAEQKKLNYPTYNGEQAGRDLGVSREAVRLLRNQFGLPLLLTDSDMEFLREHLKKTEERREKLKSRRVA